jgi:hypothetical protein
VRGLAVDESKAQHHAPASGPELNAP